ncbi:hypothetical protein BK412_15960 [Vibrio campbellii]|uniref:flippase n=1 Tax=Vibrio campbellii TaxID=680 RepID=UPI0009BD02C1|nr:flippase [Vibrio campbellii]OQQ01856.1 hypothetical protein BK412_15960 [Vibrio campbellii]
MSRIKNIASMLWEKIFKLLLSLVWVAYFSRTVGPDVFGYYSYLFAIITLISMVPLFGMENVVIKGLVERNYDIFSSAVLIRVSLSFLSAIIVYGSLVLSDIESGYDTILISLFIFLALNSELIKNYYQSVELTKKYVAIDNFAVFISLVLKIILVNKGYDNYLIIISLDFIITFLFISLSFCLDKGKVRFNKNIDIECVFLVLKQSFPFFASALMIVIYSKIDQLMIKEMLGYQELGYYSAALRISSSWWVIPTTLVLALYPVLIKKYYENENEDIVIHYFSICVFVTIFISIIVFFCSGYIVYAIFGTEYSDAKDIVKAHCFIGALAVLGVARSKWLVIKNLHKWIPLFIFCGMVVNIIGNYFLIEKIGPIGAVISTFLAQISVLIVIPYMISDTRNVVIMIVKSLNPAMFFFGVKYFINK